jgi:hypothetical protein
MKDTTTELKRHLGQLLLQGLKVNTPLYHLELMRLGGTPQKLENRPADKADQADLLSELGKLQAHHRQLNAEMLKIYELLNQSF